MEHAPVAGCNIVAMGCQFGRKEGMVMRLPRIIAKDICAWFQDRSLSTE
jgi:hypothetical protein